MKYFIPLLLFLTLECCKNSKTNTLSTKNKGVNLLQNNVKKQLSDSLILTNDQTQINRIILGNKFSVKLDKYQRKDCPTYSIESKFYKETFEGFKKLGDLNNDGRDDFVFILQPLNLCEEGQSYYFSDPNIPRISSESNCCHLSSIIDIGDIDEDGNDEIAEYYSSCVSRYKAITIYSLKNTKWLAIKSFSFLLNDKYSIEKDFEKLFRKTSKYHLEYYEITDINVRNKLIATWKQIKIK